MNLHYTILVIFLFAINSIKGQNNFIVKFGNIKPVDKVSFKCNKVIDLRIDTSAIGVVFVKGERVKATLNASLKDKLPTILEQLLISKQQVPELVIGVHTFLINEEQLDFNQVGYCDIELEFFKEINNELYSLGVFQHKTVQNRSDVTKSHKKRIIKTLEKCIKSFQDSEKLNTPGILIPVQQFFVNGMSKTTIPPEGIYFSLTELIRQTPTLQFDGKFYQKNISKKAKTYFVNLDKKEVLNTSIQYISSKGFLYMTLYTDEEIDKSILIKVKHSGRFIYFEDKSSNPQLAFLLGLTGAILSRKLKGYIYDTKQKCIIPVDDFNIYRLTKNYKTIFKTYKSSKRKTKDKENVIIELNKKYASTNKVQNNDSH